MSYRAHAAVLFCLFVHVAQPCTATELPLDRVVMVKASGHGAGLIVAQSPARTVIVTALHLVRDSEQVNAQVIGVEFNALRGKQFTAVMSPAYVDERLDLAVLFVDHHQRDVPRIGAERFANAVSPSAGPALAGTRVQLVGAHVTPWTLGSPADTIAREVDAKLHVRATGVRPGASGGALFDPFGRLLGMNSRIDANSGELVVIPMAAIARRLQLWGIEYHLGTAHAGSGNRELLAALQRANRLTLHQSAVGTYQVTLAVSEALAQLKGTFRVVFAEMASLEPITLHGPAYSATARLPPLRLPAQLWMDTPDGRSTGPVSIALAVDQAAEAALPPIDNGSDAAARRRHDEARASLRHQLDFFKWNENLSRESRSRSQKLQAEMALAQAKIHEQYFRSQVEIVFGRWSLTCFGKPGTPDAPSATFRRPGQAMPALWWSCAPSRLFGLAAPSLQLERVVMALRLGETADRLKIGVPLDKSAGDPDAFISAAVERLLTEGKTTVYGEMVLADGRTLGPRLLCRIAPASRHYIPRSCQPPRPY